MTKKFFHFQILVNLLLSFDKEPLLTELSVILSRNDCSKKMSITNNLGGTLQETKNYYKLW